MMTRNIQITIIIINGSEKQYYYLEFNVNSGDEYLYNVYVPLTCGNAVYYIDGYTNKNQINYSDAVLIGKSYMRNINANIFADTPIKINGSKFLIIIENNSSIWTTYDSNDNSIHTYYTNGSMSNNWQQFVGDIPVYVYTTTKDQLVGDKTQGDLDLDGEISIIDVRLLLQDYINAGPNPEWSIEDLFIMDLDGNELIDIIDVRLLLQRYINS